MPMMRLAPGSLPWLVLWDLRIRIRDQGLGRARVRRLLLYGGFILAMHGIAGFVLWQVFSKPGTLAPEQVLHLNSVMLLTLLFFMLMAAMLSSFRLIHAGRELTPQLSSPVPFERLLWMRVLGLVVTTWSISILLVSPVANTGALLGRPVFLLAYPVTIAMAAVVVALAVSAMSLMVALFGVLRARRVLQVLQAVIPIALVLSSLSTPAPGKLPRNPAPALGLNNGGLGGLENLLAVPAKAMMGDPTALLVVWAVATLAIVLSVRLASHSIHASLQVPDAVPRLKTIATGALHFRTGLFRVILLKEWRTILRDPRIAGALIAQPLFVLPVFYGGLLRGHYQHEAAAAMATFVAAQMSQYVGNLMISAEEAPSLLGASPQSRMQLIGYKCLATLLPIFAVLMIAVLWIASRDPWSGFVAAGCCLGAAFCTCAVEIVRPYPSPRRSFVRLNAARRQREPLDILSVLVMQAGWAAGAWFLADRSLWGALIVFGVMLVPFLEWWRDANRQSLLGY